MSKSHQFYWITTRFCTDTSQKPTTHQSIGSPSQSSREAATECIEPQLRASGLSQGETFTGRSKPGLTSMCHCHSGFNLSSTMYKIQILFTAHRVVLLGKCRSGRYLVHQILEPYTVVAATAYKIIQRTKYKVRWSRVGILSKNQAIKGTGKERMTGSNQALPYAA